MVVISWFHVIRIKVKSRRVAVKYSSLQPHSFVLTEFLYVRKYKSRLVFLYTNIKDDEWCPSGIFPQRRPDSIRIVSQLYRTPSFTSLVSYLLMGINVSNLLLFHTKLQCMTLNFSISEAIQTKRMHCSSLTFYHFPSHGVCSFSLSPVIGYDRLLVFASLGFPSHSAFLFLLLWMKLSIFSHVLNPFKFPFSFSVYCRFICFASFSNVDIYF